jgi:MraZ protein
MAAGFFGRYEHSLDAKGRLILPSKYRASFEHGGYLTQYHDGCLALFTPDEFETQMLEMQAKAKTDPRSRNLARYWAAGTQDVAVDAQGRLPIATFLREFANLQDEVLVHGAIDRIELWSPTVWSAKTSVAATALLDGDDV